MITISMGTSLQITKQYFPFMMTFPINKNLLPARVPSISLKNQPLLFILVQPKGVGKI
jgi:hypothetical protein